MAKFWRKYSFWIKLAGLVPLGGAVYTLLWMGWMTFSFAVSQTSAFADQRDDILTLHDAVIVMQQDLHDLHEWYKSDHRK